MNIPNGGKPPEQNAGAEGKPLLVDKPLAEGSPCREVGSN
jgi:hypothetical protein